MAVKRTSQNVGTVDQGGMQANEHNAYAGARKSLSVGPEFANTTALDASGAAGQSFPLGSIVGLFNNSATVAFVALANDTVPSAPSGLATGIPLKPNDWTWIQMGANNVMRTSAATVGVYLVKDDGVYQVVVPQ